jgi:hypothetical protein
MNVPDLSETSLILEDLTRPIVSRPTLFRVISKSSPCCSRACCSRGKSIPCVAVYPHKNGIVLLKFNRVLTLNNITIDIKPSRKILDVDEQTVLGYNLPIKVRQAIEHPWGAIIVERATTLEPSEEQTEYTGLVICLLVLPQAT